MITIDSPCDSNAKMIKNGKRQNRDTLVLLVFQTMCTSRQNNEWQHTLLMSFDSDAFSKVRLTSLIGIFEMYDKERNYH